MSRLLIIIIVLAASAISVQAQRKTGRRSVPPPPLSIFEISSELRYEPLYSKEELRRKFPYNKSKKVILISYTCTTEECRYEATGWLSEDSLKKVSAYFNRINGTYDTLGHREVREVVILTPEQVDSLNSLTHNMVSDAGMSTRAGCYLPRNSILFFNSKNKQIANVDICFECHQYRSSFKGFDLHLDAELELLRKFFRFVGINYGVAENN